MATWVWLAGGLGAAGLFMTWVLCRMARQADDQSAAMLANFRAGQHRRMGALCGAAPVAAGRYPWHEGPLISDWHTGPVTASGLVEVPYPWQAVDYSKVEERVLAHYMAEQVTAGGTVMTHVTDAARLAEAMKNHAPHSKAVGLCVYCGAVVDFISDSWIKRETDGVYCTANTAGFPTGRYGKHTAVAANG